MVTKLYKIFNFILAIFLLLGPSFSFANQKCSNIGYTVFTINGVGNDEEQARLNSYALRLKMKRHRLTSFNSQPVFVDYLYNPTHFGGIEDWFKALKQIIYDSENFTDYDLSLILSSASQKLKTQKVFLVAHSQGNFYANSFYGQVADKEGGLPKESIGVYGVATPSSFVAGNGKYITSDTDKIINRARKISFLHVLPANTSITLKEGDDPNGHSFVGIYLKYRAPQIILEIKEGLSKLKSGKTDIEGPCIVKEKVVTPHLKEKVLLTTLDTTWEIGQFAVNTVKSAVKETYTIVQNTTKFTLFTINKTYNTFKTTLNQVKDNIVNTLSNSLGLAQRPIEATFNLTSQNNNSPVQNDNQEDLSQIQELLDDVKEKLDVIQVDVRALAENQNNSAEKTKDKNKNLTELESSTTTKIKDKNESNKPLAFEDRQNNTNLKRKSRGRVLYPVKENSKPTYPKLLISEVHNEGTQEFVELWNGNDFSVDLTGWYIQKKTKSDSGWQTYAPKDIFAGKTIPAKSHFIVARIDTGWPGGVGAYTNYSLGDDNTLALKNPNQEIVDKVGWGEAQEFEGSAPAPLPGENSIGRIWSASTSSYIDSDNNSTDFEIQPATPNEKNRGFEETYQDQPQSPSYLKILISELKSEGQSPKDEYIELYNPNQEDVDLTGWALKKKNSAGKESNLVSSEAFQGIIPAGGYFLIAPPASGDQEFYTGNVPPDLRYSGKSYSFTNDNTILLYNPAAELVDKVGFGNALDFETATTTNPTKDMSIGRIWDDSLQNYKDEDNNFEDFVLQDPTPKALNVLNATLSSNLDENQNDNSDNFFPQVVINEIAWMGTKASFADEWIELYNLTDSDIDLSGWRLVSEDGSLDLTFATSSGAVNTIIPAKGYYLIERTDDNTVSNIDADWIGSFGNGLSNNCHPLFLYNSSGVTMDQTICTANGWPGGDNNTKQTMERIDPNLPGDNVENWASNNLFLRNGVDGENNPINGTPKSRNSVSSSNIEVRDQTFANLFKEFDEITLTKLGSPYVFRTLSCFPAHVPEGKTLIIEPGVEIKFTNDTSYQSYESLNIAGRLIAKGTPDNQIKFTLASSGSYWGGVNLLPNSSAQLEYVFMSQGGNSDWCSKPMGILKVNTNNASISNLTLEDVSMGLVLNDVAVTVDNLLVKTSRSGPGLVVKGGAPTIKNSTLSSVVIEDKSRALFEHNNFIFDPTVSINWIRVIDAYPTFKDNNISGLFGVSLEGVTLKQNEEWTMSANLPYILSNNDLFNLKIEKGALLTIEPGALFLAENPRSVLVPPKKIEVYGVMKAIGTPENPIVFTTVCDPEYVPNSNCQALWGGVVFGPEANGSELSNVILRYPYGDHSLVKISESAVTVRDSLLQYGGGGTTLMIVENAPDALIQNNQFKDSVFGIKIIGPCPKLQNNIFDDSFIIKIKVVDGEECFTPDNPGQ